MSRVFKDVETFLNAVGQNPPPFNANESAQSRLYAKLIAEEYAEFCEAVIDNDDTEKADACFDMIWVIVGYMLSRGWNCDAIWDEGALSNLKKIDKATGKVIKREDGKVLKPEGWKPPELKQFV